MGKSCPEGTGSWVIAEESWS